MKPYLVFFAAAVLSSCNRLPSAAPGDKVMTRAEQKAIGPDSVITILKTGNERFYNFKPSTKNDSLRIHLTAHWQYPKAAILSCVDSRIPVEAVFDQGIGDLFVVRVAGNVEDEYILESLEYACSVGGAKVIMVLGHEHCGIIKSAIDNVNTGGVAELLDKIQPAVDAIKIVGKRSSKNEVLVHEVAQKNVELTIQDIRKNSAILNKLEQEKKIKIIGGMYDLDSGRITFY